MIFKFLRFCFTISKPGKLKNFIFEIPIITQILSINNKRTTSAKSINLNINRRFNKYSLTKIADIAPRM